MCLGVDWDLGGGIEGCGGVVGGGLGFFVRYRVILGFESSGGHGDGGL